MSKIITEIVIEGEKEAIDSIQRAGWPESKSSFVSRKRPESAI